MAHPLITVIIPIYNVKDYLLQCLTSVSEQTYKQLEIIMVNDGSTDDSEKIANEFVVRDPRFKLISQKNAGLSAARNTGLQHARGDYVFYLDSDDYLAKDCLETLLKAVQDNQADAAQVNFYYDYPEYLLYNNKLQQKTIVLDREEAVSRLIEQDELKNFAWGKLIKADIAKNFKFPEGKFYEDTLWMYQILNACKTYVLIGEPLLYYLQRGSSISGHFSLRNLDQLELQAKRLRKMKELETKEVYQKALFAFNEQILQHINLLKQLEDAEQVLYNSHIENYIEEFALDQRFKTRHKIAANPLLEKGWDFFKKIKDKLGDKNYFVKIKKE